MLKFAKFFKKLFWGLCILVSCLGLTVPGFAQLSLVSSTPADGATDVDTLATFVFTFSAPLDTTARFEVPEVPGDFFLNIEIFPQDSVGDPEGIIVSNDLKTVTVVNLPLTDDTRFVFFLTGAKSITGDNLDRHRVITISTGSSLPTGRVSGEVTFPGGDPAGADITLFEGGFFAGQPSAVGVAASPYTINFVPDGIYFPVSSKDTNFDGNFGFDEPFGIYDPNGDGIPDSMVISGGDSVSGIDIALKTPIPETARENLSNVESVARGLAADAVLTLLGTAEVILPENGKALTWLYLFYSRSLAEFFAILKFAGLIFPVEFGPGEFGDEDGGVPDTTALPQNWIDSDTAAAAAEANGGSAFRAANPDAKVSAFLGTFPENGGTALTKTTQMAEKSLWQLKPRFAQTKSLDLLAKTASSSSQFAAWVFTYFSEASGQFLLIGLDALTGTPIFVFGTSAARFNLEAANQAALNWATDAQLVVVGNASPDLTPDGYATVWAFTYYSATKDSVHALFMSAGAVVREESNSKDAVPSLEALPELFCNSTDASPVAELNSNNFRSQYPDAVVEAFLSRGLLPEQPSRAVWRFTYSSAMAETRLQLDIDGVSCALITDVKEAPESASVPTTYALEQNYPNPFNPETVIEYQLPRNGQVELAIFNILGQKVRELVHEVQPAGRHEVRWNGTDDRGHPLPSGVYFYRLKSGEFVRSKKMIFLQ